METLNDFDGEYDCRYCGGKNTLYLSGIWEKCSTDGCNYESRVECCDDCAGIKYDYPDDEEVQ